MKVIFKTKKGYYQKSDAGKFITNAKKEKATVATTPILQNCAELNLKKENIPYTIETVGEFDKDLRLTNPNDDGTFSSKFSYDDLVFKLGLFEDMYEDGIITSRELEDKILNIVFKIAGKIMKIPSDFLERYKIEREK
jgi:hypothetical protein